MSTEPAVILYADSARGIYIPQHFAESVNRALVAGVGADDWDILEAGPYCEHYWDSWESVLDNARIGEYSLYQDGDLWLLDFARMSDEEKDNFGFDKE